MNVSLTDELRDFVRKKVESGAFPSEAAVLEEAGRRFRQDDHNGGQPPFADRKAGSAEERPLWERITAISRRIPDEEWAKRPDDASYQLDHHFNGAPKRPAPCLTVSAGALRM
jgi:Arc/MetJ-type ribon-helix-helix transcriptional regulator